MDKEDNELFLNGIHNKESIRKNKKHLDKVYKTKNEYKLKGPEKRTEPVKVTKNTVFKKTWSEYKDESVKLHIPSSEWKVGIPYVFLRTPLFRIFSKKEKRTNYADSNLIYKDTHTEVFIKGNSLTQHDLSVFISVMYLLCKKNTEFGGLCSFDLTTNGNEIQRTMGLPCSGTGRKALFESIENLKNTEITAETPRYSFKGSFIKDFKYINGGRKCLIKANPGIMVFYDAGAWSMTDIRVRRALNDSQLSQWIYGYIESHSEEFIENKTFPVSYIKSLCGSQTTCLSKFKHNIKQSIVKIVNTDVNITEKNFISFLSRIV